MNPKTIYFKRNHQKARPPFRKHPGDAGYDLHSVEEVVVPSNTTMEIDTGISLQLPENYYCEIHTRSSFGKLGARVHLGIVDSGFRGNLTIFLTTGDVGLGICVGDRIAQLILKRREEMIFQETDQLDGSSRGTDGYGSTGK